MHFNRAVLTELYNTQVIKDNRLRIKGLGGDVLKSLVAGTHLIDTNLDFKMDEYLYKRKSDAI